MNETTDIINAKNAEFVAALRSGKLEWTSDELVQFFPEPKRDGTVGPADRARASLIARVAAGLLGVDLDSRPGRYVFAAPPVDWTRSLVPQVVHKVVEKVAEAPAKGEGEEGKAPDVRQAVLIYPERPELPLPKLNYIQPIWYKRMVAVLDSGRHVAISGPPGCGKSTGPEQYFIEKGIPFVVVNGDAGLRRRDLEGTPSIDKHGSWFQVAEFAAAAVLGWACVINEVNAADADALLWLNGIIEVPHHITIGGRSFPVHPDFRLVVTYNPGLVGTKALPQAFKDRFFPIKLAFPPKAFLRRILVAKGMDPQAAYADRLLKYAADCWALHEKGNLRYQISPRRLFDVVFLMDSAPETALEDAIKQAIVDSVDSPADCTLLLKLVTAPLAEVGPVSQYSPGLTAS